MNAAAPAARAPASVNAPGSVEVSTMRGPHGNAASSAASVNPLPSGRTTSTSAACGRSFALEDDEVTHARLEHADGQRPKRGVVIDHEHRRRHHCDRRKQLGAEG